MPGADLSEWRKNMRALAAAQHTQFAQHYSRAMSKPV
jgi:hypothetical protein